MAHLSTHSFQGADLRVIERDGGVWFIASDLARALGYRDAEKLTRILDDDHKGTRKVGTPGGDQDVTVVSEPGMYRAVMRSQRTEAKAFERWVIGDVLPAIRQTGAYVAPAYDLPATHAEALRAYADEVEAHEATQKRLALVEAKAGARADRSSAVAFAAARGFQFPNSKLTTLSKRARKVAQQHGRCPERVHDERWPNGVLIHATQDLAAAWVSLGWPDAPALPTDAAVQ
ncbi:MAG: BRO family protein [Pseudomonadota bacterium]